MLKYFASLRDILLCIEKPANCSDKQKEKKYLKKKKLCIRPKTNYMKNSKLLPKSIAIYPFAVTSAWSTGSAAFLASDRGRFVFTFAVY